MEYPPLTTAPLSPLSTEDIQSLVLKDIPPLTLKDFESLGSNFICPQPPNCRRRIWVSFSKEGIHKYPAALTDPKLATGDKYDVSFLGYPHRHKFGFKVWIDVEHADRAIEFIQFKRWLESLYTEGTLELDYKSCEMIADDLHTQIKAKYPNRFVKIQVDEDGENGCEVEYFW